MKVVLKPLISSCLVISLLLCGSSFAADDNATVLTIATKGDEMAFTKTSLAVKASQLIQLTFENRASATSGLQHNWVLVNPGTADAVGQASMTVGPDKNYVADSPDVIAYTKIVSPGQKDTVQFKAPAKPGAYPFMCTFPGHYLMMKGTLDVR